MYWIMVLDTSPIILLPKINEWRHEHHSDQLKKESSSSRCRILSSSNSKLKIEDWLSLIRLFLVMSKKCLSKNCVCLHKKSKVFFIVELKIHSKCSLSEKKIYEEKKWTDHTHILQRTQKIILFMKTINFEDIILNIFFVWCIIFSLRSLRFNFWVLLQIKSIKMNVPPKSTQNMCKQNVKLFV